MRCAECRAAIPLSAKQFETLRRDLTVRLACPACGAAGAYSLVPGVEPAPAAKKPPAPKAAGPRRTRRDK
jgi:hypothetical protein